jgi:hypothetical protein
MRSLSIIASACILLAAQDKPAPVRLKPLRVSPGCTVLQDLGISQKAINLSKPGGAPKEYTENLEKEMAAWKTQQ